MRLLQTNITNKKERPIKVLQFGEGNFLRGFVDYMIDVANETDCFNGDIVIVKPVEFGSLDLFKKQECQYTVSLRGISNGEEKVTNRIVTSVAEVVDTYTDYDRYSSFAKLDSLRFIVSNTTEAGIVFNSDDKFEFNPPISYPGKLTKFLYERYNYFNGDNSKGLIILPVELIDDNGIKLKEYVLQFADVWSLGNNFKQWINEACVFCSTLVDRIVTGYPFDEAEQMCNDFGYEDNLIVTGEPFALWVIESEKSICDELPLDKAGLPVIFTDNQKPYKERKVRILNGAHTSFVLASYLAGNDFVLESMQDNLINDFINQIIFNEIIPTLTLPKKELIEFAEAVIDRFNNPYIKHSLLAISLNSVSKWRARCMPSLITYIEKNGKVPYHLVFSLASLMKFYSGNVIQDGVLIADRNGQKYKIMDDSNVLEFFLEYSGKDTKTFVNAFLSNVEFFGQDLTKLNGLADKVIEYLDSINKFGIRETIKSICNKE